MTDNWFNQAKFGMFIHWSLFSEPARRDWIRHFETLTNEDFEIYFKYFDPDRFDPKAWAELAWNAGMRYIVFITKHHEGFCMWDSKYTDYKITNTPYGKDILKETVDAFREKGFKIGLYYSLFDWHHPDYIIDHLHPLRNLPPSEIEEINSKRDMKKYTEYLHNQVKELLTNYGEISELWFDNSLDPNPDYPHLKGKGAKEWDSANLVKMIRKLQPNIMINDRLSLEGSWDFKAAEQYMPNECMMDNGKKIPWEACQTCFNNSWAYFRDCGSMKSFKYVLQILIEAVSKGGNFLLNVGPTGRGQIDPKTTEILNKFGHWFEYNREAIYGCTEAPEEFKTDPREVLLTYNPKTNRLYAHILNFPSHGYFILQDPNDRIEYARFLHDHSEIKFNDRETFGDTNWTGMQIFSFLHISDPGVEIPVVEILLK
ncbi:MAG: alpha-L-fucosidase [Abditibacteriota bacterium]|nr:alpha-L-fucosidase [Abditibacteriota bacterium]